MSLKIRHTRSGLTVRITGPAAPRIWAALTQALEAGGLSPRAAQALNWPAEPHGRLPNASNSTAGPTGAAAARPAFSAVVQKTPPEAR